MTVEPYRIWYAWQLLQHRLGVSTMRGVLADAALSDWKPPQPLAISFFVHPQDELKSRELFNDPYRNRWDVYMFSATTAVRAAKKLELARSYPEVTHIIGVVPGKQLPQCVQVTPRFLRYVLPLGKEYTLLLWTATQSSEAVLDTRMLAISADFMRARWRDATLS